MLIYILVIIFFQVQTPKSKREKKKIKRPSHPPPPPHSRISIDPCTSKIRNIYLQKTKTKQTKKRTRRWMGWGSESQEEGEPTPGREAGPHRVKVSLNPLFFPWGGYHTRKARNVSLLPWSLWRAAALSLQPNPAVNLWFVVSIIPPHPHAHTHMHAQTHRHSHACASLWLRVMKTVLEHRLLSSRGRGALRDKGHCPILSLSDLHCNMPSSSLKGFQLLGNINAGMVIG